MLDACIMGLRYYAIIFGLTFAMGIARALVIAPRLGETVGVLLEEPIILIASWFTLRHLLGHSYLTLAQRMTMGTTAFTLTMASEVVLAGYLRGQSVFKWATDILAPLGLIGLGGQIGFAILPVIVGHRRRLRPHYD